jgi:NAD(P)-dependent dehydrogenase (short-subunit alcohol dehydrogenase family)
VSEPAAVSNTAFRLDGKVAVVIGGTGVLCGNLAATYARAGATTVIVGRDKSKAKEVLDRMRADGLVGTFEKCDSTSRHDLQALVDRVSTQHGRIDVLVNGAGINAATPFLDVSDEELERIVTTNQLAVFRSCQEFGRWFVTRAQATGEGASIINIGSASGLTPLSRVFTYSMTKAAIHNLTKNLAREWGPLGIRVNVLVPGFFVAEQNRSILSPDRITSILGHTPMGRFGEPEDLAGAALLLASDAGRFITGTELVVDGGFHSMTI